MDAEGALPQRLREQIRAARADGYFVPFYYTVPDGHNPAGMSFSQERRRQLLEVLAEEGVLVVEDAPYLYINYQSAAERPRPFLSLAPDRTVHLFTGSKIGFPGPRIGFMYSEAKLLVAGGEEVDLSDIALTEAAGSILFQNPQALYGFEALLHDKQLRPRSSIWPIAETKLVIYRDNRQIFLQTLEEGLGHLKDRVSWTKPDAGFFSVFTFHDDHINTDDAFVARLVGDYGVVTIPMYEFYPHDARARNPRAGLNELRLSFCFSESVGEHRRRDLREAVRAFCAAVQAVLAT